VRAVACALLGVLGCGNDLAAPVGGDAGAEDRDPLAVSAAPVTGSLDELHQRILANRCSGQPGLCHNGQFEPNLSSPAMAYAYLVGRPGIEQPDRLRVRPGRASESLFIDKIRNRRGVATRMPLGAEPLDEADVQALEAWIDSGALRAPGAAPAPTLNNPPRRPEVAIFDAAGTRLDGAGPVRATVGATLVLRHTVQDFETPDAAIPFAAVILSVADRGSVVLEPAASDPQLGRTSYDPSGPMGRGDRLNYTRSWTIGSTLTLYDDARRTRTEVAARGLTINLLALYLDTATRGMAAFELSASTIQIP
jgi:hypothetical protein